MSIEPLRKHIEANGGEDYNIIKNLIKFHPDYIKDKKNKGLILKKIKPHQLSKILKSS